MMMSGNLVIHALIDVRNSLLAASPGISRTAGTMLITAIWQGAVVAACLTVCLRLINRIPAALRFTVWAAGFLAVAGLPFLPFLQHLGTGNASQPMLRLAADTTPEPWLRLDIRWSIALTAIWAAASLYRLVDLGVHSIRLRRLWKTATPVTLNAEFSSFPAVLLRGRKSVEICTTKELDRPSVIGFLAPRILIPEWLFAKLTPGELRQIMLHETEHLRRGDDWTNLLQKLSLIVFPLNPVLLWMERQLCLEREMACDEAVIRVTGAPHAYAACLANLAERGLERRAEALSLGVWQRRPELVRRVHRILRRRQALGPLGARGLLTVMAGGLIFGTVELSRCPQLIAFTLPPAAEASQAHALAAQAIPAQMPFRVVDTRFTEPPQAVVPPAPESAKPRPMGFKTDRHGRPCSVYGSSGKKEPVNLNFVAGTQAKHTVKAVPDGRTPRQELLKAEMTVPASLPAQEQQAQGWIVLTTWEEVDTVAASGALQSDTLQSDLAADQQSGQTTGKPTQQPAGQLKVTQLIFKVVPASSKFHTPTAVRVRGGWLVIQL